jgi:hypothetical protein
MYIVLVGHSGLGKGMAVNPAVMLLRESNSANILSDKLTIQYILEKLSDRGQAAATAQLNLKPTMSTGPTGQGTVTFALDSSCFISAPELEDLLTMSDAMPSLKELWECKDGPFEYGTRGKGIVKIAKPCPTLLGGCTPSQIALLFPNKAVGGGFVRRVNFVYESERSKIIPWPTIRPAYDPVKDSLVNDLRHIAQLKGEFRFDPMAYKLFEDYYRKTGGDEFRDEATTSYENSRAYHVLKLAMTLSVSRYDDLVINFLDISRAIQMVDKVAENLQRVFRAVGDSELAVTMDKIIRYIESRSKKIFVTRQDIMRDLWRDIGSSQNLDILLASLEASDVIYTKPIGGLTTYRIKKRQPLQVPKPTSSSIQ